jgi:hypothetical protein
MSLLEQASLVITPNAVKEGKLFSIKPTDGSGDLSVVRATTATEVGSDGVIQDVPYNLSKNSQQVGVGTWTAQNFTISTEPSGFFPFDLSATCIKGIAPAVGFNQIYNTSVSTIIGTTYTLTGFLKSDNTPYYFFDLPFVGANVRVVYDNINKQIITLPIGVTVNINDIGSGWIEFRITSTATLVNNLGSLKVYCSTSSTVFTTGVPVGTTIYATKIQLITGTEPKEYFPTTDRLNVPRLDYSNGSCPSILVEPQRTNLVTFSEQFNDVSWTKTNTSVTANSINSPSGNLTADTITASGIIGFRLIQSNAINFTSGTSYSLSVFAKKGTNNFIQLIASTSIGGMFANFDLNNGVVGTFGTITGTNPTPSITNYGDGWYRCTMNFTANGTVVQFASIAIVSSASAVRAEANTLITSVYLWGAQLEAGSNATSYIPTLAIAVTRNADVISKTGISDLIGQTEGTIFVDLDFKAINLSNGIISVGDGGIANRMFLSCTSLNGISAVVRNSTGFQYSFTSSSQSTGRKKIALVYKQNDFAFFINGVLINSSSSGVLPLNISSFNFDVGATGSKENYLNNVLFFKTRLTNQQCIDLTTL